MDILTLVKFANYLGVAIVVITAIWLTKENAGSRNMVLATGALVGALALFAIELHFELKGSTSYDHITAEFTVDRSKPPNMSLSYPPKTKMRGTEEVVASSWLSKSNPKALEQDLNKYGRDLSVFSLLYYLATNEDDWHGRAKYGRSAPIFIGRNPDPADCSFVTDQDLRAELSKAGNMFAEAPNFFVVGQRLCLPPKSRIEISEKSFSIKNDICQVSFSMEAYGFVGYAVSEDSQQAQHLPQGVQRFVGAWQVETKVFDNRAQNLNTAKYREWTSRLVEGAREWFEGSK